MVNSLAQELQRHQLHSGILTVLDRPALEAKPCECYGIIRTEFDRMVDGIDHPSTLSETSSRRTDGRHLGIKNRTAPIRSHERLLRPRLVHPQSDDTDLAVAKVCKVRALKAVCFPCAVAGRMGGPFDGTRLDQPDEIWTVPFYSSESGETVAPGVTGSIPVGRPDLAQQSLPGPSCGVHRRGKFERDARSGCAFWFISLGGGSQRKAVQAHALGAAACSCGSSYTRKPFSSRPLPCC